MSIEKIEYNGEQLPLATIAKKEGLIDITLARYYKRTGDIYIAVKMCRQNSRGKVEKIEYKGELLAISVIAQKENIGIETLTNSYKKIGNIYEAVKSCKERAESRKERTKQKEGKKIEYKNQRLELREIAKIEGLDAGNLRRCFDSTKHIYKAIFMAKHKMRKSQTVHVAGATLDLYDLSLLIGVKYSVLNNLLNQAITISQIKEMYPCENAGENIKLPNRETLLEYCVKNKLNFTFMYRAINTYGKTIKEATTAFKEGQQTIPASWVYYKYNPEFDRLGITAIHTTAIVHNLMSKQISLEEDLEVRILRKNAKRNGISEEWGEALYSILETRKIIGDEFQRHICLNENEVQFLDECLAELKPQGSTNQNETMPKEEDIIHE
ncbi:MAG: hypothetical protein IJE68_03785 [Clostridia bacterium]|nr:hypothetical protein [Clostridia bacterium]